MAPEATFLMQNSWFWMQNSWFWKKKLSFSINNSSYKIMQWKRRDAISQTPPNCGVFDWKCKNNGEFPLKNDDFRQKNGHFMWRNCIANRVVSGMSPGRILISCFEESWFPVEKCWFYNKNGWVLQHYDLAGPAFVIVVPKIIWEIYQAPACIYTGEIYQAPACIYTAKVI